MSKFYMQELGKENRYEKRTNYLSSMWKEDAKICFRKREILKKVYNF
jgi:hypothetical protein